MTDDKTGAWVTMSAPSDDAVTFRRLRLRVTGGPDAGTQIEFDDGHVRIGASSRNELVLTDPQVSGLHLEIFVEPGGVRVRDPGSTNGTWIGDTRVREVYLTQDAELRVGDTTLCLQEAGTATRLTLPPGHSFGPLVGASTRMRELFARLGKIAAANVPVLITGETGSGKEVVAKALHEASSRAAEPFVVVECASIPATLIESELFGYERGAFTGADRTFPGAFERAGAGTILLDELGELPLALQPKLLRALDSMEVRRLGSEKTQRVRACVIAATNRDVAEMVTQGTFRSDLYYRLAVAEVVVPPLRDRVQDVPLLVEHFLSQLAGNHQVDAKTMASLRAHVWPGNVRELRNAVKRIALLGEPPVSLQNAPALAETGPAISARLDLPYKEARDALIDEFRLLYGRSVVDRAGGSISAAARLAGVDRMTLYRMLRTQDDEQ